MVALYETTCAAAVVLRSERNTPRADMNVDTTTIGRDSVSEYEKKNHSVYAV